MKRQPPTWTPGKGDIVEVKFHDHSFGDGDSAGIIGFTAYGELVEVTKLSYTLRNWCYTDPDEEPDNSNVEHHSYVRSAITHITKLVPARGSR